jgi:hypothetical protein
VQANLAKMPLLVKMEAMARIFLLYSARSTAKMDTLQAAAQGDTRTVARLAVLAASVAGAVVQVKSLLQPALRLCQKQILVVEVVVRLVRRKQLGVTGVRESFSFA